METEYTAGSTARPTSVSFFKESNRVKEFTLLLTGYQGKAFGAKASVNSGYQKFSMESHKQPCDLVI
jgi:hypothetical protein